MDSDTSSSDEELLDLVLHNHRRPKNEGYLEVTVSLYNNKEFVEHFRISREIAQDIASRFEESEFFKDQTGGNGKLSAYDQTLIFLWFAGHATSSFRDVGDRFDITISCLFYVLRRMIYFLSGISATVIKWPSDVEKVNIESHFREKGFPGVIGAIDGSHIKIDKPKVDPDSYLNRKHFHSIQMQAVCDHDLMIRDIFIGYPGSVHDSRVFRNSPLCAELADRCHDFYLLGDSGYPCLRNLLTPFKDRGNLTAIEANYNLKLSANRYVIEHCFGLLKQKWRQLYHIKLKKINDIVHFIRACCVLHNLSITDDFPDDIQPNLENPPLPPINEEDDVDDHNVNRDAADHRNFVARQVLTLR